MVLDFLKKRECSEKALPKETLLRKPSDSRTSSSTRLKKTKSAQSLVSVSTTTSVSSNGRSSMDSKPTSSKLRQPSTRVNNNKKTLGHMSSGDEDESRSTMRRSLSNGSTASERRNRKSVRKKEEEDAAFNLLKDELEMEKTTALLLKGQKEAIAKDLDYFCNIVDELTEEKETIKRKYEEEVNENKLLRKTIHDMEISNTNNNNDLTPTLEGLQQQMLQEQYVYYNNLQLKNNEISKLKADLKQAQNQIQILRKTMQQLLKSDDSELLFNINPSDEEQTLIEDKELLLKSRFFLDLQQTELYTSPVANDEDDRLSTTSRESSHSHKSKAYRHSNSVQYDFLKTSTTVSDDDFHYNLTKRRSEDFSKSFARRRKDQLEEILGDVDSQLNRAKQKIRPVSS